MHQTKKKYNPKIFPRAATHVEHCIFTIYDKVISNQTAQMEHVLWMEKYLHRNFYSSSLK